MILKIKIFHTSDSHGRAVVNSPSKQGFLFLKLSEFKQWKSFVRILKQKWHKKTVNGMLKLTYSLVKLHISIFFLFLFIHLFFIFFSKGEKVRIGA